MSDHSKIIEWALMTLKQTEIKTEIVVEMPWSSVIKISTPQREMFLKETPPNLFIEVEIIKKCRDLCKITDDTPS